MTPAGRGLRARHPGVPVLGSAVALAVWGVVAHDSGAGWVQAVGALVAGLLVVALVAPAFAVARARCSITDAPADAVAGDALSVGLAVSAPLEVRPIDPPGPALLTGRSADPRLELRPEHRGMVETCTVLLASAAPFGLLWWTREVVLPLARPVAVAPRTGEPDGSLVATAAGAENASHGGSPRGHELRGARPYELGDRPHLVHWPATAHTGALMVREHERRRSQPVTVHALLPEDPIAAEGVAERAMGTVAQHLAAGAGVALVTLEGAGRVEASVLTVADAGRRLARALPRPPRTPRRPPPEHGWRRKSEPRRP